MLYSNAVSWHFIVNFFRFQIISKMLGTAPGIVEATTKRLSQQSFYDVLNKRMISYTERTKFFFHLKNFNITIDRSNLT